MIKGSLLLKQVMWLIEPDGRICKGSETARGVDVVQDT